MKNPNSPSIVLIDLETSPSLSWVFGFYETDVIAVEEDWRILSFAWKELGSKKTNVKSLPDYPSYKKDIDDDKALVKDLWKVMNEADILIAHNGDKFDFRKANARFLYHGLQPPSPYKTVDTLKIARRHFKFDSNRLDDLARYLKIGKKLATQGFKSTWLGCVKGDDKAWKTMCRYNMHDVDLLEAIYFKLRAWSTSHPHLDSFTKNGYCPTCQSSKVQKRGINVSKTGYRERLHCQSCGAWYSGNKHFKNKENENVSSITDKQFEQMLKQGLKK
jgi:transcription elongation factor Elf1